MAKSDGNDDVDEQLREVDGVIAAHDKQRGILARMRKSATLKERVTALEEQVHGLQLLLLHQAKANLMTGHAMKASATKARLELERLRLEEEGREILKMVKLFKEAKTIGRA